jgi:hypothetical protein
MFIKSLQPLTNRDIINLENELKIKDFRGVFMRDTLPSKINKVECGILNLDISKNNGTHWVCYYKNKDKCYYFDSFGLDPPLELQNYLNSQIELSTFQIQKFNTHHCGYYCLLVLKLLEKKYKYKEIF